MLDVTRLAVLVAVARTGSVTAAARELHYAQPSVSHHLARLEARVAVGELIRRLDGLALHPERPASVRGLVFRKPARLDAIWS